MALKNWIVYTCFFVLAFPGFYNGISGLKPRLSPENDEIILEEGEDLKIECKGDRQLQFLPEERLDNHELEYESSYDEGSRLHKFVFKNVSYLNTAWYACAEAGVDLKNNDQIIDHSSDDISWIYVYVNSSRPFAYENSVRFFHAVVGQTVVVPCRPTSPDLTVRLQVDLQDYEGPSIPYDPKVGYVLENITRLMTGYNYGCAANMPGPDGMGLLITLQVIPDDQISQPMIDEKSVHHVIRGKNHTFICNITTTKAPDGNFGLHWRTPPSVPESRISQRTFEPKELGFVNENDQHKAKHSIELTVRDVEISDGGEYACYRTGANQERGESSVKITISDPNFYFINVTIDKADGADSSLIVLNESDTAVWKIQIDTYPPMIDLKWYKPNLEEIMKGAIGVNHTHKYSHSEENMEHLFRISDLELKDNGNYTLEVITSEGTQDTILALRVDARPLAVIENPLRYYAPGKSAIFTCEVLASPQPNITWTYLEYPDYPSKSSSIVAPIGKIDSKPVDGSPHIVKSSLNITLRKEGDVTCKACNSFGCSVATEPIFLSDMGDQAFSISDPGLVTVGDTINLTCSAWVHNYTSELYWSNKQFDKIVSQKDEFSIINRTTNFTHQSTINIENVTKSHAGMYSCSAFNSEGKTDTTHFELIVKDAQRPKMLATNVNGSKVVINLKTEKDESKTLYCIITGMPIPKIIWLKDNEELRDERHVISKGNSTLHLNCFSEGDSGRYSCRGVNRLGVVEHYIDIVVEGEYSQNNSEWIVAIIVISVVLLVNICVVILCVVFKDRIARLWEKLVDRRSLNPDNLNGGTELGELAPEFPTQTGSAATTDV